MHKFRALVEVLITDETTGWHVALMPDARFPFLSNSRYGDDFAQTWQSSLMRSVPFRSVPKNLTRTYEP